MQGIRIVWFASVGGVCWAISSCAGPTGSPGAVALADEVERASAEDPPEQSPGPPPGPPPSGHRFSDVARVATIPCSTHGFENVRDCYNEFNPPAPSLERRISTAWREHPGTSGVAEFPSGLDPQTLSDVPAVDGDYAILPFTKSTSDGRISFAQNVTETARAFRVNRPENLNADGFMVGPALTTAGSRFHTLMMLDPIRSNWSNVLETYSIPIDSMPTYNGADLCETTSTATELAPGRTRSPYRCESLNGQGAVAAGDCYDVTLLGAGFIGINGYGPTGVSGFELRSVNLTIFVGAPHGSDTAAIRVYPRTVARAAQGLGQPLPAFEPYTYEAFPPSLSSGSPVNWRNAVAVAHSAPAALRRTRCYLRQADGTYVRNNVGMDQGPRWCAYFDNQRFAETLSYQQLNDGVLQTTNWNGRHCAGPGLASDLEANPIGRRTPSGTGICANKRMDLPSVTKDGRLLIMRLSGNFYSFNESDNIEAACQADQFRSWRTMSSMPSDPRINNRYPVAMTPLDADGNRTRFRDALGQPIPFNHEDFSDYTWIDREGRNIFYSAMNTARNTYAATTLRSPAGITSRDSLGYRLNGHLAGSDPSPWTQPIPPRLNPSHGSATFVSVLGAWTRGRVVNLDNALNATDWSGFNGEPDQRIGDLEFPLYRDQSMWIAPLGSRHILSMENQWYYLNARRPVMPFDVVWQVANDSQHNAEVVFDEYLNDQAMAVVHMNTVQQSGFYSTPEDGFTTEGSPETIPNDTPDPNDDTRLEGPQRFAFRRSPRLQNAATGDALSVVSSIAQDVHVYGGARIEPIGLGGVIGKGLYLDGVNDHVAMQIPVDANKRKIYLGLWLDLRREHVGQPSQPFREIVYTFADASTISLESTMTGTGVRRELLFETNTATGWQWCVPGEVNNVTFACATQEGVGGSASCLAGDGQFATFALCQAATGDPSRCYQSTLGTTSTWCGSFDGPISGSPICPSGTVMVQSCSTPAPSYRIQRRLALPRMLRNSEYFHLGLILDHRSSFVQRAEVFINGTSIGSVSGRMSQWVMNGLGERRDFWIGNPGVVAVRGRLVNLQNRFGVEAWIDEFRMYWLHDQDLVSGHFREYLCNLALGTLVDVSLRPQESDVRALSRLRDLRLALGTASYDICEQLQLVSHNQPTDLAPQQGESVCVEYVHRNASANPELSSRCLRSARLGLTPLAADSPRPDTSQNRFCLSCHNDTQSTSGLRIEALTSRPSDVIHDPRRQPLNTPAILSGTWPMSWPDSPVVVPADQSGRSLDPLILGQGYR